SAKSSNVTWSLRKAARNPGKCWLERIRSVIISTSKFAAFTISRSRLSRLGTIKERETQANPKPPGHRFMLAKLNTFALVGMEGVPVQVEVDASAGLPKTILVGLPEASVRESQHRIERALVNLGFERHPGRTVINLAPADLPKAAGAFDLPIALGLLVA